MRILITGGGGQVGTELRRASWPAATTLLAPGHDALDIADAAAVAASIDALAPDLVINAAAYTAVDRAESEPAAAFAVNADAPGHLAEACAARAIPLIHLSTDYVFDGTKPGFYTEDDAIAPLGVYGRSKAAGEARVRAATPRHVILRTAWVYAAHGGNFVRTMLRLGAERPELRVVADQHGCPTSAADIAAALVTIAGRCADADTDAELWGTYHFCGAGATTWHGFADEIFRRQQAATGRRPRLVAIATADYPTPARRPANSRLDCTKARRVFGLVPPPWQDSLAPVVAALLREHPR